VNAPSPAIDYFSHGHPMRRLATPVALRARNKMYRRFAKEIPFDATTRVIDIGVTPDRTLADSNYFERLYPHPTRLTATSIEDASFLEEDHPGLTFVRTDGDTLPFDDGAFDVAFSSAVLEHVGDRDAQRRFVAEMCRVAERFYLTTPNRWFPVEVHTMLPLLHWLPQPRHQALLRRLGKPFWADTSNLNLLGAHELRELFPEGVEVTIEANRTLGWPSNLIAHGRSPRRPPAPPVP
jgi:SAM-dependent methyltransferase